MSSDHTPEQPAPGALGLDAIHTALASLDLDITEGERDIAERQQANSERKRKREALARDAAAYAKLLKGGRPADEPLAVSSVSGPRASVPSAEALRGSGEDVLRRYIKPVESSSRASLLNTGQMLLDVMAQFEGPVERNELLNAFYERFPRELLQKHWKDVPGAVAVAIRRLLDPKNPEGLTKLPDGRLARRADVPIPGA